MKRYIPLAALALFVLTASDAVAQPGGGRGRGPRGGFGGAMLLQQASVQKELKLSDEQLQKVTELAEKQREAFAGLRDLEPEERREKMAEAQKSQREELAKILSTEQGQRLKQIEWQQAGPQALANPEVAAALGLSDEQKQAVETAQTEMREQMRELFAAGPDGDREAARAKMTELQTATNEKINKVLTAEQQTKLKELLGAPFTGEIVRPSFRGRRQSGPGAGDNTNALRQPFFQLTSFKEDDDDDDDAKAKRDNDDDDDDEKADKDNKNDKKKVRQQGDDHKARGKKHHKHADHKEHAAKVKRRHGQAQHAGDHHHGRRRPHGHPQWARHMRGPNAETWNRVAETMGRPRPGAPHGRYAHYRWQHAGGHFGHPHPGPWAFQFERRGEGEHFAHHGFAGQRHWSHGPMHGAGGRHFAPPPHFADHDGPRHHGHGPAHFAHHRGPHGPHHFATWRQHRGPHFQGGEAQHEDGDFRPRERQRPPMPPAPPRAPDFRRSEADAPADHLTRDDGPGNREEQLKRLAQLERSLDRLAEQLEQLRRALR